MALVGNATPAKPQTEGQAPANASDKDEAAFKAAKKAAADKHREKIKAEKQEDYEMALLTRDVLQKKGAFDDLPQNVRDYILAKCVPPAERQGHTGPSFFTQVFGDNAKVGDSTTLKDVISKTYKGMDTMQAYVKKWAGKGTVVTIAVNKQDMLSTKYTIEKIGA